MVQAIARGHRVGNEPERLHRCSLPVRPVEGLGGIGNRMDHQAVPVGKHLVISRGLGALGATIEEFLAKCIQLALLHGRQRKRRSQPMDDVAAIPVAIGAHVMGLLEQHRILAQHRINLGLGPGIEGTFLPIRVGIKRRGKAAALHDHVPQDPRDRFLDA